MPYYDVSIILTATIQLEAENEDKAEEVVQHYVQLTTQPTEIQKQHNMDFEDEQIEVEIIEEVTG